MKILVLGADGSLGSALVDVLADQDLIIGTKENFDLTKFEQIAIDIKEACPEVVVNAAGFTDVAGAETEKEKANLINGQAVGNLAKICLSLNIPLLHFSTDYVFTGNTKAGYSENDQPAPLNVYGQSKLLGEQLLINSGCSYYLVRTSWLFGPKGINFIEKIKKLSKIQAVINVVNDQIGCPTYTYDLARGVRDLLLEKAAFGVYHLTNSGQTSWYELAVLVKKILGFEAEIKPVATKDFSDNVTRPLNSVLLNTKLPKLRNWTEAVEDYLKHN